MAKLAPRDAVKFFVFGNFESLLPSNDSEKDRRYGGNEVKPPSSQEITRVAPIIENDRHYNGLELQSPNVQEKSRVAPSIMSATNEDNQSYEAQLQPSNVQEIDRVTPTDINAPNDAIDRKAIRLPQQSDAVDRDRVSNFQFPQEPPLYQPEPPKINFIYGTTFTSNDIINSNDTRGPKLSFEYRLEPPNEIHLRVKIKSSDYWVSELDFNINFCNGEEKIMIEDYHPENEILERKTRKITHKQTTNANIGNPSVALIHGQAGVNRQKDFEEEEESFIEITGIPVDGHSMNWTWRAVGGLVGPLRTTFIKAFITIPNDSKISQLTASITAWPKVECVEKSFLQKIGQEIGRIFGGQISEPPTKTFTIKFN